MHPILSSNEKRIQSCKKRGGNDKRQGHERETEFNQQFNKGRVGVIEYTKTSDSFIEKDSKICQKLRDNLDLQNESFNVSIKGKKSIQFTLGNIPELSISDDLTQLTKNEWKRIFEKYLKKNNSQTPADIFVYKCDTDNQWLFFNMDKVIDFMTEEVLWRKSKSGRSWKGDMKDNSRKGISQYLTFEFRKKHKSSFLGINGGKGIKFINLLKEKIPCVKEVCSFE